ncbi:MAG: hypothetical protein WCO53_13355 [Deltaproteobacteria bacterium]
MGLTFRLFQEETAEVSPSLVVDYTQPAMTEAYIKVEPPTVRSIVTAANKEIQPLLNDIDYQMPYIDKHNDLVIPFKADPKYFYWNGGQPIESTLDELNISAALWSKYSSKDIRDK